MLCCCEGHKLHALSDYWSRSFLVLEIMSYSELTMFFIDKCHSMIQSPIIANRCVLYFTRLPSNGFHTFNVPVIERAMKFVRVLVVVCIAGMLFAAVDALSDEEVGVPAPVSDPGPRISKRKRRRLTKETKPSKEVDPFAQLQTILDDDCPCKQKTCSRQFLEPTMLAELSQYVREWHSLGKLDQDRIAP